MRPKPPGRPCFTLQWLGDDGQTVRRSTGIKRNEELARQKAVDKSRQLQLGGTEVLDASWVVATHRYEDEHLAELDPDTSKAWRTARNHYTRLMRPQFMEDVTTSSISRFRSKLRQELEVRNGRAKQSTVASYLKQLRVFFGWAHRMGLLGEPVEIVLPRRARGVSKDMRRRPIQLEEFERILMHASKVRPHDYQQWQRFLLGAWYQGYRRGQLTKLSWDWSTELTIDLSYRRAMIRLTADAHKRARDEVQPVHPALWELLKSTPDEDRVGLVLPLADHRGRQYGDDWIGRVIARMGKKAGVKTGFHGEVAFATCHDLRRSSSVQVGNVLSELDTAQWMGHASSETTRRFYHWKSAEALADRLYGALGEDLGEDGLLARFGGKRNV